MDIILEPKPWYVKYRYYIATGVVFLAFVVYVITLIIGPRQLSIEAEEYKIVEVKNGHFMEYIDVEGVTLPILTLQINAMESGFVSRIVAEEGTVLNEGDTILVLTNPELLRSIEDERDAWQNSQRNYREQEIEMEQKSITLRQQALDASHQMSILDKSLKQSREEYRMGIKSKAELEVAEEEYEYQKQKTQLQMQGLRHDSVATRLRCEMVIANREAESKKLIRANSRTSGLVVRAPISGQLSYLAVTPGQQVSTGMSIGQIKDLSQYKIHTSLNEYYIDRISTGLPAKINYQETTFPLSISRVVPEVKDRSFKVDLVFSGQKPSNIRLGKSYRVQIELGKPERAIIIPRGDFYQHTSGKWIYRLSADGKKATKVEIEVGRQNPQQYEIVNGLKDGDKVIVSGYDKFDDIEELLIK